MSSSNKFGFAPLESEAGTSKRKRSVGPMGAAVREAAESLQETTEAKVEQRRQNAHDAKEFRAAQDEGRVLVTIPLADIQTSDLPRDRLELEAVATSDEMEELKSSIRQRGQKEPVEVYQDAAGLFQLKKGWRRFTALSQLLAETGEAQFGAIIARVETGQGARLDRYVDMVEENVVREDLTFAEMAQVAITAAQDPEIDEVDPDAMVGRLYGSLHKMKRSYIRSFVFLLSVLGEDLKWPKEVARNLGVDVARALKGQAEAEQLCMSLSAAADRAAQNDVLAKFVEQVKKKPTDKKSPDAPREKFEFHVGDMKVTARQGECRIVSSEDFASVPRHQLEKAVRAFEEVLAQGNPRVTSL
ncbi:ParB/RepB/Spo0J family partition protein [Cochlodiniinecator piscidefendens]|uniref:ParB/RepB/Spo0J family partition protein n=1 Tax=Cochlodiniinecator piscidefendens TaxID=2715756 RepID=UPI00140CAD46|nr:ParB N-terminal domain-containing protein [Cochlodiniinecator piscidefendens]